MVQYASNSGAFVDLAADLAVITVLDADHFILDQHTNGALTIADTAPAMGAPVVGCAPVGCGVPDSDRSFAARSRFRRRLRTRYGLMSTSTLRRLMTTQLPC